LKSLLSFLCPSSSLPLSPLKLISHSSSPSSSCLICCEMIEEQ
jgi:hypothetical protein